MTPRHISFAVLLFTTFLVSACGGGAATKAPDPAPTQVTEPEPAPEPSPEPAPEPAPEPSPEPVPEPVPKSGSTNPPEAPLVTNIKNYIFGHSLISHALPAIPTPSDETTVPHWMSLLAQEAGYQYSVSGQYGFLRDHATLPPRAQWGYDIVPSAWDDDSGDAFEDVNFNTVLLTAGNFIQYQSAMSPYDGDNPDGTTPLQSTLEIVDWLVEHEPGIKIYIYENWPDMDGYSSSFPPTEAEFDDYNAYVVSGFHTWWLDYHDEIIAARPDADVKMIPVGPIITRLLDDTGLRDVQIDELYEDDAPHGRPTIYFLASLITYMSIYGVEAPADYQIPSTVHSLVQENYADIVSLIWRELQSYTDESGNSRVW